MKVGLIGAGNMGALHARVVSENTESSLAFVVDPDLERAHTVADMHGTVALPEPDLRACDAVIVAAPTHHHVDVALEVIEAGIPLLVEKPLADDFEGTRTLIERSEAVGVPLSCNLVERFNPAVMLASSIIENPVQFSAVRHSPYVSRVRTGVASDLAIHDIDLALRLFKATPTEVTAEYGYPHPDSDADSEDVALFNMGFANGGVASVSASRVSQKKIRSLSVAELDRLIEIDLLRKDVTIHRHVKHEHITDDFFAFREQTIVDIPVIPAAREPLAQGLDHFLGLCRGDIDPDQERATLIAPHAVIAYGASADPHAAGLLGIANA